MQVSGKPNGGPGAPLGLPRPVQGAGGAALGPGWPAVERCGSPGPCRALPGAKWNACTAQKIEAQAWLGGRLSLGLPCSDELERGTVGKLSLSSSTG